MPLRLLDGKILVLPDEPVRTTRGGIHYPETAQPKPARGRVIAVGPPRVTEHGFEMPMRVKPDDIVLYAKHSGQDVDDPEVMDGGKPRQLIFLMQHEIFCIVD